MTQTKRAEYVFTVKEYVDGTPWIAFEPMNGEIEVLKGKMLGFDLQKGIDINKAKEITKFLNDNLSSLTCTYEE